IGSFSCDRTSLASSPEKVITPGSNFEVPMRSSCPEPRAYLFLAELVEPPPAKPPDIVLRVCERLLGAESRPWARRRPPVPGSFSGGGSIPRSGSFITSRPPVLRIPSTLLHVTFFSLYIALGPSNNLIHALGRLLG